MRNIPRIRPVLFVAIFSLLAALSQSMFAAPARGTSGPIADRVTQHVTEEQTVRLGGNTRPEANLMNDRGAVPDLLDVDHILLVLQRSPEQERQLDRLIAQQNDRKSPNFHKWLTAEEFGKRFGVSQNDIDNVTSWLQSHGFRINQVYPSRIMIDFSGTAGQIRAAFHSEMHQLNVDGEQHISNMSDPQIPAALAPVIKGIASLNDFKPEPMYKSARDYTYAGCASSASRPTESGTCYAITPQDNQTIYGLNPLYAAGISGQGQTIALVEDTDTYGGAADWNTYRSTFGLSTAFPLGTYSQVHPGGCTDPGTNADDGEAAIDVEVASAVAPSAAIELISCAGGSVTFGGLIAMQNLFNTAGPYPGIVSVSYGVCEAFNGNGGNAAFYNTYQQGAAEGISIFVSSGDEGPSQCSANFSAGSQYDLASLGITGWGETPYNVSVGGTDFEDTYNSKEGGPALSTYWGANTSGFGSAKSYIPEMPWDDACANIMISEVARSSFNTYGASGTGTCNTSPFNASTGYLIAGAGAGGPSNCATGQGGTTQSGQGVSNPQCQGYPKPTWQSGSSLTGGQAVYGVPSDGVRDTPDVSMFAANGLWGHFETVCWSDPTQTSGGAATCTAGNPSAWSGFGGTSVAAPTMAAIQALVNQKTGTTWGNPNPFYYQIAQNQYGTAGGTFLGAGCNSSTGNTGGCAFNDVTEGDIDTACRYNGTTEEAHCYKPSTNGVASTDNVTAATVISGGSGYTSAPTCTIAGPSNAAPYKSPALPSGATTLWAGGTQAACTATVNSGTTNAVWTVTMSSTSGVGDQIIIAAPSGSPSCGPYTLSGTSTTLMASNLVTAIGTGCSLASAASSGAVATLTAKTAGAAGNFAVNFGTATEFDAFYVYITNTTKGQGPNYVSGITITTAGSGYQPETPITLTGIGTGAIAVANTSPATGAQSYQPAWGAGPGYDLATGLGTPNARNLVNSCAWVTSATPGIASPVAGSTLTPGIDTFCWVAEPGATAYWLDVAPTQGGNTYWQSGSLPTTTLSQTVNTLPNNGSTVWARLWYFVEGTWNFTDYQYNASGATAGAIATLTNPTPNGSALGSTSVNFTWQAGTDNITNYWIDVGSVAGGNQYKQSGALPTTTLSATVNGLPTDGSQVYVTLYSLVAGTWLSNSYNFFAVSGSSCLATITSPSQGSTLGSLTQLFSWTPSSSPGCSGAVTAYWLDAGSSASENFFYQSGNLGLATSNTAQNLPPGYGGGQPPPNNQVQMTLWNLIGGTWIASPEVGYCGFGSNGYPTCASGSLKDNLRGRLQDGPKEAR